jgi:hypothetical protein
MKAIMTYEELHALVLSELVRGFLTARIVESTFSVLKSTSVFLFFLLSAVHFVDPVAWLSEHTAALRDRILDTLESADEELILQGLAILTRILARRDAEGAELLSLGSGLEVLGALTESGNPAIAALALEIIVRED